MISVHVQMSRSARENARTMEKLRKPMILGEAMAQFIARRVQEDGDLATRAKPYSTSGGRRGRSYKIGDAYAQKLNLQQTAFVSSAAMHQAANVKPGTFYVTGGMWSGLQVRNWGSNGVIIDFRGSTLGGARQSSRTRTGRERSKPVKVRNNDKAARVFRSSGVNIIQPKDSENEACGAAICRWSQRLLSRILGAEVGGFTTTADAQLLQDILRRYDGST